MKSGIISLAGICGVLFPIILFGTFFSAISVSPSFDWNYNYLSDLGGTPTPFPSWRIFIYGVIDMPVLERPIASNPMTVKIFNTGIILSSIFLLIFAVGLRRSLSTTSGRLSALILIIGAIGGIFAGIFPFHMLIFHMIASAFMFLFPPTAMCCIGVVMTDFDRDLGYFTFLLGIIGYWGLTALMGGFDIAISLLLGTPFYHRAIPEIVAAIVLSIFTIIYGVKMFKSAPNPILSNR